MDLILCAISPVALAFDDRLHPMRTCGNDIKGKEQEMAGMGWPLLFLIARIFIMKMQFHSISGLAQSQDAVSYDKRVCVRGITHPLRPLIVNE